MLLPRCKGSNLKLLAQPLKNLFYMRAYFKVDSVAVVFMVDVNDVALLQVCWLIELIDDLRVEEGLV